MDQKPTLQDFGHKAGKTAFDPVHLLCLQKSVAG